MIIWIIIKNINFFKILNKLIHINFINYNNKDKRIKK